MEGQELTTRIVNKMLDNDKFSQWLGIELISLAPGACELSMKVREEMTNGFSIAHGGISFSFADSALAFASNGHGHKCVSIETSISHFEAIKPDDVLTAKAEEIKRTNRLAWYIVQVTNQENKLVASFKGTVYRTFKEWKFV